MIAPRSGRAAAPSWLVPPFRRLCARRSLVLAYHGVAPSDPGEDPHNLRVAPGRFQAQVALLLHAGFEMVTVTDLAERAAGGKPPPGLAALSFDDGMEDNHSVLLPILREYGIPATVYVTTGLIGQANPWLAPESGARMMTEAELCELSAAGVELGAHTVTHPDMSLLDHDSCLREMVESKEAIERLIGTAVSTFAYPFCRYGEAATTAAADAGFIAAVTCEGRGGWSRYEIRRAMITGKDGWPSFLLKAGDAYQPLFDSRAGRLLRAGTRQARSRVSRRRSGHG